MKTAAFRSSKFCVAKKITVVLIILSLLIMIAPFIHNTENVANAAVPGVSSINGGNIYYIRNQRSGLYLDVFGVGNTNGTAINQDYYNGGENQRFKVECIATDVYEIIPMHAQHMRLDITGASTANETRVQLYQDNNTPAQRFKIISTGNGDNSFKILTGNTDYTKCAVNDNDGISMINASVAAGAKCALGFNRTIMDVSARSFTDNLFTKLAEGDTVANAAIYAASRLIWPWDNCKDYQIAGSNSVTLNNYAVVKNNIIYSIDKNLLMSFNKLISETSYKSYKLSDDTVRYFKTINGVLTDAFYDITYDGAALLNIESHGNHENYEVKPINFEKNINVSDSEQPFLLESHLVYININNAFTPVLIDYMVYKNNNGYSYSKAICTNLFDGSSINYGDINTMK